VNATELSAKARGERLLAVTVATFRLGSVVTLPASATAWLPGDGQVRWPMPVILATTVVQSVVAAYAYGKAGRLHGRWVAADLLLIAVAFAVAAIAGPSQSRLFGFALIAVIEAGAAPWPIPVATGAAVVFALITLAFSILPASSEYPLWNAVPDPLSFSPSVLIASVGSHLVRRAHRERDRHRALDAADAAAARQQERGRQAAALRAQLLSTMDEGPVAGRLTDPVLASQVRREAAWLRTVVKRGLSEAEATGRAPRTTGGTARARSGEVPHGARRRARSSRTNRGSPRSGPARCSMPLGRHSPTSPGTPRPVSRTRG
jgi:hypothetical protein